MRFSIIVPVYNVYEYLIDCLDSLLDQSFKDYEVILVNDGSTDDSPKLCEKYAKKYPEIIKYFSKENGGLSDARNYGMNVASGEYLIFVDSDDWVSKDALENFDKCICDGKPDVIVSQLTEVYGDHNERKDSFFSDYLEEEFTQDRAVGWNFDLSKNTWPAQKTIVSHDFVDYYNLKFLRGRVHEDLDWTSRVFMHATNYYAMPKEWYFHRMKREGSITNSIRAKNIIDTVEMATALYNILGTRTDTKSVLILKRIMESVYAKLNQISLCKKDEIGLVVDCVNQNMGIFRIMPSMEHKLFSFVLRLFGARVALTLLRIKN